MSAQFREHGVRGLEGGDCIGCEDRQQPALPVEVLALYLFFGLGGSGIARGDSVELEVGS